MTRTAPNTKRPSTCRRGSGSALLAFGTVVAVVCSTLPAGFAGAGESIVESLGGARKFAPLWPGGTFDQSEASGHSFARVVTDGQGGGSFASNVRPYKPVIDATGKFVKLWVKVDDVSKLGGMEFRFSSDRFSSSYFAFPIELYDDPDFNVIRDGVWTLLTFSFGSATIEGTPNRAAINSVGWYVADKGGEAPITAYWGGVALVDEPEQGVLSFTFDDGYDEHHLAAVLMAEHGFPGTAYIIPDAIGQEGYMTLHQLVDLQEKYGWDVAAHHETPFTEMRPDELESTILGVQRYLEDNEFGSGAGHLAYPLGKQNTSLVRPFVRKHFTTARVATSGPETLPPADPHLLRVFNVTDKTTPQEVGEAALRARQNKEWLILMLHYLVEKPENDIEYSIEDFKALLAEVKKSGIDVKPLVEVFNACGRPIPGSPGGCSLGNTIPAAPAR